GPAEEGLAGVVSVLRRGLALLRCRLWLRSPAGSSFIRIASPDDETQLPVFTSSGSASVTVGPHSESVPGGTLLRLPLIHEEETLGVGLGHENPVGEPDLLLGLVELVELPRG